MALHRVLYHLTAETLMIYSLTVYLHWLLIKYQIEYKIAVIVYSVVNTQEPSCLADIARFHALSPHLHSSNRNLLQKDRTNLEFTDHSFSHAFGTAPGPALALMRPCRLYTYGVSHGTYRPKIYGEISVMSLLQIFC